jgi:hypothetical protein
MQKYVIVDVEADGPIPGPYSMVCFGAVELSFDSFKKNSWNTFYGQTKPISDAWDAEALRVSGFSREQHKDFPYPQLVINDFSKWLRNLCPKGCRPIFVSDNPAYDFQWMNYYFWKFGEGNPFGFSGRRIGDLYCGAKRDLSKNAEWKKQLRITKHTHNPIDDAIGNAEALCQILTNENFKLGGLIV